MREYGSVKTHILACFVQRVIALQNTSMMQSLHAACLHKVQIYTALIHIKIIKRQQLCNICYTL